MILDLIIFILFGITYVSFTKFMNKLWKIILNNYYSRHFMLFGVEYFQCY
jgi:hypothetical protein